METRTQKFKFNTAASTLQQLFAILIGLILPRVILRYYGSEINGLTASIVQFVNYFTLVEAGIGASAVYALYKPLAQGEHASVNSIIAAARKFYILSGYIFLLLLVVLAFTFPFIRLTTVLSSLEIGILVLAIGASGVLDFFVLSKFVVLLTADQRHYVLSISLIAKNVINVLIIVSLATLQFNIAFVYWIAVSAVLIRLLIIRLYVGKRYSFLNYRAVPDNSAMQRRWDALYLQILGMIHVGAPVIIATIFLDYLSVSIYSVYYLVIGGINGLLGIFTSGLSASFGDVIARGEKETLQRTYKEFEFIYCVLITVVYSTAMLLIMPFVRIYTTGITDVNYDVPLVGLLIVLNGFFYNLKTPQGMLIISAGLYRETRWRTTIQGLIAVVVGAALAPIFGLPGIIIGSILSNLYRDIDLLFFIPKHVTRLPASLTMKRWFISVIEFILILLPFYYINVNAVNYLQWFNWAVIIVLYAAVITLLCSFILDRTTLKNSAIRIIKMIGVK